MASTHLLDGNGRINIHSFCSNVYLLDSLMAMPTFVGHWMTIYLVIRDASCRSSRTSTYSMVRVASIHLVLVTSTSTYSIVRIHAPSFIYSMVRVPFLGHFSRPFYWSSIVRVSWSFLTSMVMVTSWQFFCVGHLCIGLPQDHTHFCWSSRTFTYSMVKVVSKPLPLLLDILDVYGSVHLNPLHSGCSLTLCRFKAMRPFVSH